jgi:YVTN family beta-propeller protein
MKTLIKIVLGSLGVMAVVAIAVAGYLIYPGTPSSASSLKFQGYVPLPSATVLSVLDYLTVNDDKLFVTGESTGDVYKVQLRKDSLPAAADVTKLAGEPAAHGVVIDPSSHLAFVTRSEANTVDIFDPAKTAVIKRIPVADDPDAIFYDEFDKLVYVASGDSHLATLIDPSIQTTIATIPLGGAPEYAAFDTSTRLLYQNLHDTSTVQREFRAGSLRPERASRRRHRADRQGARLRGVRSRIASHLCDRKIRGSGSRAAGRTE